MLALAFQYVTAKNYKVSRNEVMEISTTAENISLADFYFILSDSSVYDYILIDIRDEEVFEESHFEGARNIPFKNILNKKHRKLLKDEKYKILIADNEADANAALILLTGMAYENIYVLPGGYEIASQFVSKEFNPAYGHYSEDKAKFDFSRFMDVTIEGEKREIESVIPEIETQTIVVEGGC